MDTLLIQGSASPPSDPRVIPLHPVRGQPLMLMSGRLPLREPSCSSGASGGGFLGSSGPDSVSPGPVEDNG